MPKMSSPPAGPVRYGYEHVIAELMRFIERSPRGTHKRLAISAGLDASAFSHRLSNDRGCRFSYEQLGAIAAAVNAPSEWPFITWEAGEAFDSFLKVVKHYAAAN